GATPAVANTRAEAAKITLIRSFPCREPGALCPSVVVEMRGMGLLDAGGIRAGRSGVLGGNEAPRPPLHRPRRSGGCLHAFPRGVQCGGAPGSGQIGRASCRERV